MGVHNATFAIGVLKASIANLTGISTSGGLPDAWEIHYFGPNFATNPAAGPNAINNNAGVPNWMMYALGLAPTAGFTVGGSGVIYFDGNNIVNGATNTIAIYTAAEIAFLTPRCGHHLSNPRHLGPYRQLANHQHQHSRHRWLHQLRDPDAKQRLADVLPRDAHP